jgi:hypothetical protein
LGHQIHYSEATYNLCRWFWLTPLIIVLLKEQSTVSIHENCSDRLNNT